jgi:chromosome segregation ATPase
MILFIILGVVVLITFVVLGVLFFMLSKEGQNKKEEKAVPVVDLNQLKKELSSGLLTPQNPKVAVDELKIIPPFEPKVSIPTQETLVPAEDDAYKKRVQELENELKAISLKADSQSDEAKQLIESLTKENESLKSQQADLEKAKQGLIELEAEASGLKTDNQNLQTQLETTSAKVQLLEEQMAAIKIQMGEEIAQANAKVEALLSAPKPESDPELRQELEALKAEHAQLKQKYEELDKEHQKLQYEMIKAKAQSSGLERISFNYKNQLEDFFKKINAMQVTNEHLSQVKNRLEGMVEQVKLQNEELTQKDQLAQFELEKNRSRLLSLEREYEDLKARTQQKDAQA